MRKILFFSLFLVLGLVGAQVLPGWVAPDAYASYRSVVGVLLYICLGFIMINVGREFEVDKLRWRSYVKDYGIAMATAEVPWLLVTFYFVFVLMPDGAAGSYAVWKENLFLSRFTAPTSAGILFTMLACLGLGSSWIYKKTQTLAIFDDLDTILLMIPLQIMVVGPKWEILAILIVVPLLLVFGWRRLASFDVPQSWWAILSYSVGLFAVLWLVYRWFHVHIEILLPAFVLGMVMRHKHYHGRVERWASSGVSFLFTQTVLTIVIRCRLLVFLRDFTPNIVTCQCHMVVLKRILHAARCNAADSFTLFTIRNI